MAKLSGKPGHPQQPWDTQEDFQLLRRSGWVPEGDEPQVLVAITRGGKQE